MAEDQLDLDLECSGELKALIRQDEARKTRIEVELASSDKFTKVNSVGYFKHQTDAS